jgi:hypothetical protein
MIMTTALEKDEGCQQPFETSPEPVKEGAIEMGGSEHEDFSSRTRRVRRKPLVKK